MEYWLTGSIDYWIYICRSNNESVYIKNYWTTASHFVECIQCKKDVCEKVTSHQNNDKKKLLDVHKNTE